MIAELAQAVAGSAEVVAAILAVAITVVAIVVELAATRFSHRITFLFVREPLNAIFLGFLIVTTLLCLWVGFGVGGIDRSPMIVVLTITLISLSLVLIVPYLGWVFTFISPLSIIATIRRTASRSVAQQDRLKLLQAIGELQEIARSAIERVDRGIALCAVEALTSFLTEYQEKTSTLEARWFELDDAILEDPDFLSMESAGLAEIEQTRLWVEVKVFRQLIALVPVAVPKARDIANAIGIDTRKLGSTTQSPDLRRLVLRCFNSYLRSTINAHDPRTAYYLLHQYRLLGEHFLDVGDEALMAEIAMNFQFYGLLGYENGQGFLLEVAAHDLVELLRLAIESGGTHLTPLVDCLLDMDQKFRDEMQEQSLAGVRREQLIAASMLMQGGYENDVERVLADLRHEEPGRLLRIYNRLMTEDREQYWEFTDRGTNFEYLRPELRAQLQLVIEKLGLR